MYNNVIQEHFNEYAHLNYFKKVCLRVKEGHGYEYSKSRIQTRGVVQVDVCCFSLQNRKSSCFILAVNPQTITTQDAYSIKISILPFLTRIRLGWIQTISHFKLIIPNNHKI